MLFWVSLLYAFLAVLSLAFWGIGPEACPGGTCGRADMLLGRSVWLWGAAFYSLASVGCLVLGRRDWFPHALLAAALLHWVLLGREWAAGGEFCVLCVGFAAQETLGAGLAFLAARVSGTSKDRPFWAAGPLRVLALLALALLAANPSPGRVPPPTGTPGVLIGGHPEAAAGRAGVPGGAAEARAAECLLPVRAPDGAALCLDLKERPALLFAVWCPHCQDALKEAAELPPERRPWLVAVWLREGDAGRIGGKLAECGLAGEPWYLAEAPPEGVRGVPCLVWWEGGLEYAQGAGAVAEKLGVPQLPSGSGLAELDSERGDRVAPVR